ncbi:anthocyanin 3'-O-beta-glucosyltransferase [Lolium perenne]|uniref:anthocyanin 3'-O-beta-glucosyltransferase n=1 Tax=Lolium perenne TaxID=4522 RepID=UPI0021F53224|nr:anthocyanin 3'-O-beta-glucosyltransferase-like [Lolium perenne]
MATTTTNGAGSAQHAVGRNHIVVFPFMAKGHTIPLLHFATALSVHHKSLRVTMVTTPANLAFARSRLPSSVRIAVLAFPSLPPLPAGVESTDALPSPALYPTFLRATALLRAPFADLLASLSSPSPPLVLVSDFFLGFTHCVAADAGVRRVVFHGMSCFSMAIIKSLVESGPPPPGCDDFHVPRMPEHVKITAVEVPDTIAKISDRDDPVVRFVMEDIGASDVRSWGVLVNSFAMVDQDYVAPFESFYQPDARAWLAGPLFLAAGEESMKREEELDPEGCLPWLDKTTEPVVYVSFGTQAHVSDEQLDELARGLVQSGHPFLWAVRSENWSSPVDVAPHGRVIRGWVPQRSVLAHRAVGGFVSHCGWNSVMESLAAAKPVLAWPMMAEQHLNAKHVADIIGAGFRMNIVDNKVVVDRAEVEKMVRRLMDAGSKEGREMRARAAWARQEAKLAVSDGGMSHMALLKLVDELQGSYDRDVTVGKKDKTEA